MSKKKVKEKAGKKQQKKVAKRSEQKKEKKPKLYRWGKAHPGPWKWERTLIQAAEGETKDEEWSCGLFGAVDPDNPTKDRAILYLRQDTGKMPYAGKLPSQSLARTAPELAIGCESSVRLFKKILKQNKQDEKMNKLIAKLVSNLEGFLQRASTFDEVPEENQSN